MKIIEIKSNEAVTLYPPPYIIVNNFQPIGKRTVKASIFCTIGLFLKEGVKGVLKGKIVMLRNVGKKLIKKKSGGAIAPSAFFKVLL